MSENNIDADEIAKFAKLSNEWWDKEGSLRTLHDLNPIRLQFIQNHIDLKDKTVLDVGCGGGILSEAMARVGAQVTGIDMDEAGISIAKNHAKIESLTIDYRHQTVESLAKMHPHHFDVITCMEMLEHVPSPAEIIDACAKLLKPNGKLFVSTLNRHPKAYALAILGAEYVLKLLPRGTHDYNKFIKPAELVQWARDVGLSVEEMKGVSYHPFTRKCALVDDVKVNYLVCFN